MGVEIDGLSAMLENTRSVGPTLGRLLAEKINQTAFEAAREAKRILTTNSSVSTGLARSTIRVAKTASADDLTAIVSAGGEKTTQGGPFDYVIAIEFGTEPHFPPVKAITGEEEPLDRWVVREGIANGDEAEGVAFAIAVTISQRGTDPQPFMRPAAKAIESVLRQRLASVTDDIDL